MPSTAKRWTPSNTKDAKYIGTLEFSDDDGEFHDFEILQSGERLVFGGPTNNSFLESGYMEVDEFESLDENLSELLADLKVFYNEGKQYTSRIVCNERM